jgi:D-glycero-alpha-D-manno-heptose 1-phosphate guanylyltransferase
VARVLSAACSRKRVTRRNAGESRVFGEAAPPTTIAVTQIREAGRYGTVEFDAANRITAFREKANRSEGWINGGVYLMNRATLSAIDPHRNLSIETDIFPTLAESGSLRAFPSDPPLLDMGTPEGIREMESFLSHRP